MYIQRYLIQYCNEEKTNPDALILRQIDPKKVKR